MVTFVALNCNGTKFNFYAKVPSEFIAWQSKSKLEDDSSDKEYAGEHAWFYASVKNVQLRLM